MSSKIELPANLLPYTFVDSADRMHDLIAFASLVIDEGATTAAEAAILGSPALYVNTLTMGYTDELESHYELLYISMDLPVNGTQSKGLVAPFAIAQPVRPVVLTFGGPIS